MLYIIYIYTERHNPHEFNSALGWKNYAISLWNAIFKVYR